MKKYYKSIVCVLSCIAAVLMLLGIIMSIFHGHIFGKQPWVWYYSATNFILFAILFHLAGTGSEPEKKA